MTRNLKQALFSALLVWAVAYPVLGLKLTIVGINLEVHKHQPPCWRPSPSVRC
jgi:branched-chain amino acid transport system permease protein